MKKGYQHSVLDYYIQKVDAMRTERKQRLANIDTREKAEAYKEKVRKIVAESFGEFPERCPLDPVITGIVQGDGFRVEKVRFSSRPGYWVTGNLYIPNGLTGAVPAVLGLCGHADTAKLYYEYEGYAQRLARNGFVVLIIDPVHQGERFQYGKLDYLGQAEGLCQAHNVMGKQLQLVGEHLGLWRVWDARRGVDYLLTRPEVDGSRIGITGTSGGGTTTEWTWAVEDRLAFAVPSCHVTTFKCNIANEMPTDAEQCLPGILAGGLEMVDLMFCQAPKPVLLLGQKYDFFDPRGLKEAAADLKEFYSKFGAEDKVQCIIEGGPHGYSDEHKRDMIRFFRNMANMPGEYNDTVPVLFEKGKLYVTPTGNVVEAGSSPIYELIAEKARKLKEIRVTPATADEWKKVVSALIHLPELPAEIPDYRIPWPEEWNKKYWGRFAVETEEGGIRAVLHQYVEKWGFGFTLDPQKEINLVLPNFGSEEDIVNNELPIELGKYGETFVLDVRGLGETMPEEAHWDFHQAYGMDYMMHCCGLMFNESYLGRRVYDVLRVIQLLKANGADTIHLHGRGQGAILAAFALVVAPELVTDASLYDAPQSYEGWIESKVCDWPSANVPHGVLKVFDLPDLYKAFSDRLTVVSFWNSFMKRS